jgi:hypothetical protein
MESEGNYRVYKSLWTLFWAHWIHTLTPYLKTILILSSNKPQVVTSLQAFQLKFRMHFSASSFVLPVPAIALFNVISVTTHTCVSRTKAEHGIQNKPPDTMSLCHFMDPKLDT